MVAAAATAVVVVGVDPARATIGGSGGVEWQRPMVLPRGDEPHRLLAVAEVPGRDGTPALVLGPHDG